MPPWSKGQTLDFYIKMDTIFIITNIFIAIYNTWYDSCITHLFVFASEDTEQNSPRLKTIWSERENLIDENRQKHLFLPPTVKNSNQYQPSNNLKTSLLKPLANKSFRNFRMVN